MPGQARLLTESGRAWNAAKSGGFDIIDKLADGVIVMMNFREVMEDPLQPGPHVRLAGKYARRRKWAQAIAEYRTAMTLGGEDDESLLSLANAYLHIGQVSLSARYCEDLLACTQGKLRKKALKMLEKTKTAKPSPLESLPHLRYGRLKRIAGHIEALYAGADIAVLDVGGGDGLLCLFLPDARYALAEPSVNGISGESLPFANRAFDVVVSCHVLEHVPKEGRHGFLHMLCSKARSHVLLLNPFAEEGGGHEERTRLVVELTGAGWAKEHLACGLPALAEVRDFASARGILLRAFPNGSKPTALAYVFLQHYANRAGRGRELERINRFFNESFPRELQDGPCPNDYLVELDLRG